MYTYKYPHPAVTTDSVVFGFDGRSLHILLIERGIEPYKGMWALPGGFMRIDETIEQCAKRELCEETGISDIFMEQFHVFSSVYRDPRERVLTVAFIALIRETDYILMAGDDASSAGWFSLDELPPLAFDHRDIIDMARRELAVKLRTQPIAFKLLDESFSMAELQRLYEAINNTTYDRRNFAKKMNSTGYLQRVDDEPELKCCMRASEPEVEDKTCERIFGFNSFKEETDSAEISCSKSIAAIPGKRKGVNLYRFDEETFNDDTKDVPPGRNSLLDI